MPDGDRSTNRSHYKEEEEGGRRAWLIFFSETRAFQNLHVGLPDDPNKHGHPRCPRVGVAESKQWQSDKKAITKAIKTYVWVNNKGEVSPFPPPLKSTEPPAVKRSVFCQYLNGWGQYCDSLYIVPCFLEIMAEKYCCLTIANPA